MSTIGTTGAKVASEPLANQLAAGAKKEQRSLWLDAMRRLVRNKAAVLGLIFITFEVVIALAAPLVAPSRYDERVGDVTEPPSRAHPFGTDRQGRDVLSRVIYGARVSLAVGFVAQFIILSVGVPLGLIAGFYGRWIDTLLMRFVDIMYAFPDLLLMVILMTYLRNKIPTIEGGALLPLKNIYIATGGIFGILLALAFTSWLTLSRLVRGEVLGLKQREFVEAAHCIGASNGQIIRRHLLPNAIAPIIISATIGIPSAILAEAALSFIGIGVNAPTPSWGMMISESGGIAALQSVPHTLFAPAIALALTVLAFNFLGDGLRDALDPRMKR